MKMVDSLIHNDTHSIVKQALAKNDGIKLRINLVLVENGQNGNRIGGRQSGTKNQTFKQGKLVCVDSKVGVYKYQKPILQVLRSGFEGQLV